MRRESTKRWGIRSAIALTGVLVAWFTADVEIFRQIHLKFQDIHFLLRGPMRTNNVILITLDEKSLNTLPELQLFWHPYYAETIRAAGGAGAKVIGLDIAFAVPVTKWEPDHDRLLAEAVASISEATPVICGYIPNLLARQREWPVPVNMIAAALGLSAYTNLTADPDDFVRRQELIEGPHGDVAVLARSFALRVAEKYLGSDASFDGSRLELAGAAIPIDAGRSITINFAGPPNTFPRVSLSDFIAASRSGQQDQLRQWVGGKAVLIGPDHVEDRHATPFYTLRSSAKWNTPGVEIHASALTTLLDRSFLAPVSSGTRALALGAVAISTTWAVGALPAAAAFLWIAGASLSIFLLTHLTFRSGFLLPASELLLSQLVCVVGALVYRFASAEQRGDLFRRAVSLFVGRDVAKSLDESKTIALSATRENVTILFTDVRGFTAFCEAQDPVTIVNLLNRYLAEMVDIIVRHQGQVNKFLGDGILAIFSDRDGATAGDHAQRAVLCAREIVTWPSDVFKTGAGIHTGPAVIGAIGSSAKMEYTVLGDTVNLASRLESLNKEYKTKLLLSESTAGAIGSDIELAPLGAVPVRGKSAPVKLYTLRELQPAAVTTAEAGGTA